MDSRPSEAMSPLIVGREYEAEQVMPGFPHPAASGAKSQGAHALAPFLGTGVETRVVHGFAL